VMFPNATRLTTAAMAAIIAIFATRISIDISNRGIQT
jgi:hypothetical protein